jgi:NAD(P)-dependent dehydrogenase (short-subunit alcohol dehydrogenase family)
MSKSREPNRRTMLKATGLTIAGAALGATTTKALMLDSKQKPLSGKVALITGAARGIGLACAKRLAMRGADIVLCDIAKQIPTVSYPLSTEADLNSAAIAIRDLNVRCLSVKVDVRDSQSVKKMMDSVKVEMGRLDIVVANAGIAIMENFEDSSEESWHDVLDVNLIGAVNTVRHSIPLLKVQESGRIICIASQLARKGSAKASAYTASKWAMLGFTKSIALELGKYGITCNCVCPTATDTGMLNNTVMLARMSPDDPTIKAFSEKLTSTNPIPSGVLSPETVADMVEFLCFPESAHLSGTVMDIASNEAAYGAY